MFVHLSDLKTFYIFLFKKNSGSLPFSGINISICMQVISTSTLRDYMICMQFQKKRYYYIIMLISIEIGQE